MLVLQQGYVPDDFLADEVTSSSLVFTVTIQGSKW